MSFRQHRFSKPAAGAFLAVLCGLALWGTPLGDRWVNASYDHLFRFGARTVTNQVVLILMDNESFDFYQQKRGQPWDRALHAELLNRLANDGCGLVVLDAWFHQAGDPPSKDQVLAEALRRQSNVVLMAEPGSLVLHHAKGPIPDADAARPLLPTEKLLSAANTNWGIAWLDWDRDLIIRRHWPFPAPGPVGLPSLPWTAARLAGTQLPAEQQEQWLRYYGRNGAWDSLSYRLAMTQRTNYFRNKTVFIGNKPQSSVPEDGEEDKVSTPYTHWTSEAVGGVEIMATAFLNLVNGEWLRRPARWTEISVLLLTGTLLGGALCQVRRGRAFGLAAGTALLVMVAGVWLSHATNYWFPWLVIAGGQVPCALAWALVVAKAGVPASEQTTLISPIAVQPEQASPKTGPLLPVPDAPDYEVFNPPFGQGAYGRVWLVQNAIGQWQALKAVYRAHFGSQSKPYDREFNGIRRYKPISDGHPGLLRVDFISKKKSQGYFYYVMELGDGLQPGWEQSPSAYTPRDLATVRARADGGRLPARECLRIGIGLAEALDFLHGHSLTHGDIKPQNIIFVGGQPKLADVGLVAEVRPAGEQHTRVGTPGYMPPPPEPPGTPQADLYGLGMVLYVIFTGRDPDFFPSIATTLVDNANPADFMRLNAVILRACQPDLTKRFASAREMADALRQTQRALEAGALGS